MFDFFKLSDDIQITLFLLIAEDVSQYLLGADPIQKAENAIGNCRRWVEKRDITGDDLYCLVDSNDENTDITDMQADAVTKKEIIAWDCIINAIVYTCRKAYELNKEQLPQAIEVAVPSLYDETKNEYIQLNSQNVYKIEEIEEVLELKDYCMSIQELTDWFNQRS